MKISNASTAETKDTPKVHPSFEWLRSEHVETLNVIVEEYRHKKTGAQYFHLASEDIENVFLVGLRTVPTDSRGVAHVLEHTALCGSERYPVRDPFFMMIRRSLNTFMNAFTSSDWTAYPFASQNKKDFSNLLDVYLDAVFFSRLHELDFAQEGHRVEFEKPDDPGSDLVYKGVVFNEMKGAMSSPVSTLWQTLTENLFPTTTYHYNSGGDPEKIPDLTYEQLNSFYKTHYHPSNAVFMTYGDIPAYEHQQRFETQVLSRFKRSEVKIEVKDEQRLTKPVHVEQPYAIDASEAAGDKTHIVMGWLLGHSTDLKEQLKAHLLSDVLLGDSASPLRFALETTKLGNAPSPLCGLEDSNREMAFMCGLEGSSEGCADELEQLVFDVLNQVADKGVPQERIETVLHQLELHQREIGGDGFPYGLQLILNALSPAIHRGDPVAALNIDPVLEDLRKEIQDSNFVKQLVRTHLLDNIHRVRLVMQPDTGLAEQRIQMEKDRLSAIKAGLDEEEKARIIEQATQLATRQEQQDDPGILPKVGLDDVPSEMKIAKGETVKRGGMQTSFFVQGTNGLVYQQIIAKLPNVDEELMDILPYYTTSLTELGCGNRDYLETQAWQSSVTGGISAYTSLRGMIDNVQKITSHFILSGKALARNHAALCDLMQQTLEHARFDELPRLREIIAQERAQREQRVTGHGHSLVMTAAVSGMSPSAAAAHRLRGLVGISYIKKLDDSLQSNEDIKKLAEKIQRIHKSVNEAPRQFLVIGEHEKQAQFLQELGDCWSDRKNEGEKFSEFALSEIRQQVRQLWVTSTQVNFCAKAYPTVPVEHADAAALEVLGGFLKNGYLHRAIREQGGAYGGGASHDTDIAAFRFYSYRDPRLTETLNDFDHSIEWLLNERHEWRQVEEAILGVIGNLDKPGSPAGEAKDAFHSDLYGRTAEQRNRFRERVLTVTLEDLQRVAGSYLMPENASVAVLTNSATMEECGDLGMEIHHL